MVIAAVRCTLLFVLGLALAAGGARAQVDDTYQKEFGQLALKCTALLDALKEKAEATKFKDLADGCSALATMLKTRMEAEAAARTAKATAEGAALTVSLRGAWRTWGPVLLVVVNVLMALAILVVLLAIRRARPVSLVQDPAGKLSFGRVVGVVGTVGLAFTVIVGLNVVAAHLFVFGTIPDGVATLAVPVLAFLGTYIPYIVGKLEQAATVRLQLRLAHAETVR